MKSTASSLLTKKNIIIASVVVLVLGLACIAANIAGANAAKDYYSALKQHEKKYNDLADKSRADFEATKGAEFKAQVAQLDKNLQGAAQGVALFKYVKPAVDYAYDKRPQLAGVPLGFVSPDYRSATTTRNEVDAKLKELKAQREDSEYYYNNFAKLLTYLNDLKIYGNLEEATLASFGLSAIAAAQQNLTDDNVRQRLAGFYDNIDKNTEVYRQAVKGAPLPERYESERAKMNQSADEYVKLTNDQRSAFLSKDKTKAQKAAENIKKFREQKGPLVVGIAIYKDENRLKDPFARFTKLDKSVSDQIKAL